jgi:hypothetical protein
VVLAIGFVLVFVVWGLIVGDIVLVLVSLPAMVAVGAVWLTREVWRANAERWRQRRDGAF